MYTYQFVHIDKEILRIKNQLNLNNKEKITCIVVKLNASFRNVIYLPRVYEQQRHEMHNYEWCY